MTTTFVHQARGHDPRSLKIGGLHYFAFPAQE
jgi:hypothetical protein